MPMGGVLSVCLVGALLLPTKFNMAAGSNSNYNFYMTEWISRIFNAHISIRYGPV